MPRRISWCLVCGFLGAASLLAGRPASAVTRIADSVVISDALEDDLYAVGGEVRIEGSVAGTTVAAAGTAEISGDVAGDVILAGGRVTIDGGVGDDLRAVGGTVTLAGFVTDQATIAGGTVTIGPDSAVGGRTWVAAGDLDMAGQIGGNLKVAAGTVVISGRVAGDVEVAAREIRIEPGAVIGGNLIWRSAKPPVIAEDARILGQVLAGGEEPTSLVDAPQADFRAGWPVGTAIAAAALVLLWFNPGLVSRSTEVFRAAPGRTLLLGLAALVMAPVLAVVLFVTVLGWLLGLVVLAGYFFGLLLAGLLGVLIVVQLLRGRFGATPGSPPLPGTGGWRGILLLLLVVAMIVGLQQVAVLGGVVTVLLVLTGLGVLTALVTGRR